MIGLLCSVALAKYPEEPCCNVIRPKKVDAKVRGCQVSEPGEYQATVGDLIEIEYTFPIVPTTLPKKVGRENDRGAIAQSELGVRDLIVPNTIGTGTYLFYFKVIIEGSGTATVVIDDVKYEYTFKAAPRPKKECKEKKRKEKKAKE
jgi:hypothetical protein